MGDSYEFRFVLTDASVRCDLWHPDGSKEEFFGGESEALDFGPDGDRLDTIAVLEAWLKRWEWIRRASKKADEAVDRVLVPDTFKLLGTELYRLAMRNEAGGRLSDLMQDRTKPSIRLLISFDKGSAMSSHPWEFLCQPDEKRFLATETDLVLGRFVWDVKDAAPIRCADEKVSVLFIMAVPKGDQFGDPFSYERARFRDMYDNLGENSNLQLQRVDIWNPTDVTKKGNGFTTSGGTAVPVDVVHFIGVCRIKDGEPELYLPAIDSSGHVEPGARWTGPEEVVSALTKLQHGGPALVILHLSDLQGDEPEHFESVAPAFVGLGISAVMAMQYPMSPDDGWAFAEVLYEELSKGTTIGSAVQMTRSKLRDNNPSLRHFGTPVLFMQSRVDGALISKHAWGGGQDETEEDEEEQDAGGVVANRSYAEAGRRPTAIRRELEMCIDRLRVDVHRIGDPRAAEEQWQRLNDVDNWLAEQRWPREVTPPNLATARRTLRKQMRAAGHEFSQIYNELLSVVELLADVANPASA